MCDLQRFMRAAMWVVLTAGGTANSFAQDFVAGVRPDIRPENAPVMEQMNKDAQWYRQALTGVHPPYPASFRFLEDQGRWHTPFVRPGMTGRYDLRGWHAREAAKSGS